MKKLTPESFKQNIFGRVGTVEQNGRTFYLLSASDQKLYQVPITTLEMLSDLRESGSLEQDADIVMFLYRDEVYEPTPENAGLAEVIVAKQRNGPTGVVRLSFLAHLTRFESLPRE
jgi:replicative DNA helicase